MDFFESPVVRILKRIEIGSAIAVRLTKYTGKSSVFLHPKHFLYELPWYTNDLDRNDIVLDLGSGSGQSTIKTAQIAKKVVSIEIDENLLKLARRSAKLKSLSNIIFEKKNLEEKLSYKNSYFTKVIFLDVLEHLVNRDQILKEIRRVLKPKGILYLGVPNSETSWKRRQRKANICSFSDPDHKVEFSEKQIKELLKKHNFKILNFSYGKSDTPYRGLYDIIGAFSITLYRRISDWRQEKSKRSKKEASGFEIKAQKIN